MLVDDSERIREASRRYQVVTVIGARGTGKSSIAEDLTERWAESGVTVVRLDAAGAKQLNDLLEPVAIALKSGSGHLSAAGLEDGQLVRIVLDRCEELHDASWLMMFQERWRALLSEPVARGRLGAVLLGRPLFRELAGGDASPLLNLGPVTTTRPLESEEISRRFGCPHDDAEMLRRKTGGHPAMTRALWDATGGNCRSLKQVIPTFLEDQQRYLIRLAEDHSTAGVAILSDLLASRQKVPEATLLRRHVGGSYARGIDVLDDLVASGLVVRADSTCAIAADLLRNSTVVRQWMRAPDLQIPDELDETSQEVASLTFKIENRLRMRVAEELGAVDPAWWPARIPARLVAEAEARRQAERDSQACPSVDSHPLLYLSLGELLDVIQERENWAVFEVAIGTSKDAFGRCAQVLTAVRNKVAHSRACEPSDAAIMRNAAANIRLVGFG